MLVQLSSCQIFNVKNQVQVDNLSSLAVYLELGTVAPDGQSAAEQDDEAADDDQSGAEQQRSAPFQRLEILIRDWQHWNGWDDPSVEGLETLHRQVCLEGIIQEIACCVVSSVVFLYNLSAETRRLSSFALKKEHGNLPERWWEWVFPAHYQKAYFLQWRFLHVRYALVSLVVTTVRPLPGRHFRQQQRDQRKQRTPPGM